MRCAWSKDSAAFRQRSTSRRNSSSTRRASAAFSFNAVFCVSRMSRSAFSLESSTLILLIAFKDANSASRLLTSVSSSFTYTALRSLLRAALCRFAKMRRARFGSAIARSSSLTPFEVARTRCEPSTAMPAAFIRSSVVPTSGSLFCFRIVLCAWAFAWHSCRVFRVLEPAARGGGGGGGASAGSPLLVVTPPRILWKSPPIPCRPTAANAAAVTALSTCAFSQSTVVFSPATSRLLLLCIAAAACTTWAACTTAAA